MTTSDQALREGAMAFLRAVMLRTGGPVRNADVANYFFEGERVRLMDIGRGIRKPARLDAALSIRTVHATKPDERPYFDDPGDEGFARYKWRGTDPDHSENRSLRTAMQQDLPLIWFQGFATGLYLPVFPIYLVGEEPEHHQFVVALDEIQRHQWANSEPDTLPLQREYAERTVRERLHQPMFRERVLAAYGGRCGLCRLGHAELLDAAHITPDSEGGQPVVPNGISMCKLHHAAFDRYFIGIQPRTHRIEVRPSLLDEVDGPTLRHSIQELNGASLELPRQRSARPSSSALEERYEEFLAAS